MTRKLEEALTVFNCKTNTKIRIKSDQIFPDDKEIIKEKVGKRR